MAKVWYPDSLREEFKVKLMVDDISIYKFIEFVIEAYIHNDERIMQTIKDYAPDNRFKTLRWYNKKMKKHQEEAEEYLRDMSLNEDEIQNIFKKDCANI